MANIIQINGYTISSSNTGGGPSFPFSGSAIITGSLLVSQSGIIVTGSISSTRGFTGSLFGTSSWASTSSWATNALTASFLQNNDPNGLTLSVAKGITLQATDSSTGTVNLQAKNIILSGSAGSTTITSYGNILPGGPYVNNTSSFNLGSPTAAWKDIYVSNGSINFISGSNSSSIQFNNGQITFSGANLIIPSGSTVFTASFATNAANANDAINATTVFVSDQSPSTNDWSIPIIEGSGGVNSILHAVGPSYNPTTGYYFPSKGLFNGTLQATLVTSSIRTNPGTTSTAPLVIPAGTNLTSPTAGAIEYDGTVLYSTNDASSQRGYVPSTQIFRLTGNGTTITTIANFFGTNSAIQLAAGGVYEIEAYCYLAKVTLSGTATITITTSAAPVNLSGIVQYGLLTNGSISGTANQIALFNSTNASAAFAATGTLTTSQSHAFIIRLIVEANASASNLRINFTSNAGGLTPLRNSYYKVTKLPSSNTGNFVA